MKTRQPIHVEINILRGRDWTKAAHYCLEFRSHVGDGPAFELSFVKIPHLGPAHVESSYVIGRTASPNHAHLITPLLPPALFFHPRGKEISVSRASWARAGRRQRGSVARGARTYLGHDFAAMFGKSRQRDQNNARRRRAQCSGDIFSLSFLHLLLQTLLCSTHACSRTHTHECMFSMSMSD